MWTDEDNIKALSQGWALKFDEHGVNIVAYGSRFVDDLAALLHVTFRSLGGEELHVKAFGLMMRGAIGCTC